MIEETFVDDPADCQDYSVGGEHFDCTVSTEIEYVVENLSLPSDGIVLAESAMNYPAPVMWTLCPQATTCRCGTTRIRRLSCSTSLRAVMACIFKPRYDSVSQ